MDDPAVSVIICTRNRAPALRETLDSLKRLETPSDLPYEVLIVDNASTDETPALVQSAELPHAAVRYLAEHQAGLSHARNRGMAEARGHVLLFTDDDVRPPAGWISAMASPIIDGFADAVAGGVEIAPHLQRDWMEPYQRMMLASTEVLSADNLRTLVGANMAFSRDVLRKVPAFDTELGAGTAYYGEESLFAAQLDAAGFRFASALETKVVHHFAEDRLRRSRFLQRMEIEGKTQAYIAYHWRHALPHDFWKYALKYALWPLLRTRFSGTNSTVEEGISAREMAWICEKSFFQQYRIESKRPRNYEKYGLVKRNIE